MNNQFTTVISYDKPALAEQGVRRGILKGEVGSLLKALAFMALWVLLTGLLVLEPLMSTLRASLKQDHASVHLYSSVVASDQAAPNAQLSAAAATGPAASPDTATTISELPTASAPIALNSSSAENSPSVARSHEVKRPADAGAVVPTSRSPGGYSPSPMAPQLTAQAVFNGQAFQVSQALLSLK